MEKVIESELMKDFNIVALPDKTKEIKEKIAKWEAELKPIKDELNKILAFVPNIHPDDTPLGGEEANREEKKWGETKAMSARHLGSGPTRLLLKELQTPCVNIIF